MGEHTAEDRGVEGSIPSRPIMKKYDGLIEYSKLIRDKIPEIIEASGARYKTHVAGDDEYRDKLRAKLLEEVKEFLERPCVGELADIQEVINALAEFEFGGVDQLEKIQREKAEKRGKFEKRIILDETDNR